MTALLAYMAILITIAADHFWKLRLFWPYDMEVFGIAPLAGIVGIGCTAFFMPREWEIITKRRNNEDEIE